MSRTTELPPAGQGALPAPLTRFLGRRREATELRSALVEARLVTLVGAPGCGKTRLAAEVVRPLVDRYGGGVWFVDLATITDPGEVANTLGGGSRCPGPARPGPRRHADRRVGRGRAAAGRARQLRARGRRRGGGRSAAASGLCCAYNDYAIQALDVVLREATGEAPADYAAEHLFEPIGARHTTMATDPAGNTHLSLGLRTTCRDAARFGLLFLRQGDWGGRQVVPREWVREATGAPSQSLFPAYGYLWWLNRPGDRRLDGPAVELPAEHALVYGDHTQLLPGAPDSMYWAVGAFGQVIQVDPDSRTVVVRLGGPHPDGATGMYFLPYTARVVTEALTAATT